MAGEFSKLINVLDEFRILHSDIQSQAMLTFLYIAEWNEYPDPVYVRDIAEAVGVPSATASRNVTLLTKGTMRQRGLDLVIATEDPMFRTRKILTLTTKGKKLAQRLKARMK